MYPEALKEHVTDIANSLLIKNLRLKHYQHIPHNCLGAYYRPGAWKEE